MARCTRYNIIQYKILENEEYKEIIKQLISKYQKKLVIQKTDPRTLWDVFKAEVRDVTVYYFFIFLIFVNFTIKLKISPTSAFSFMINF
jgi:hypothetical protein